MKRKFDGYVHSNKTIQVKRMPFGESCIDQTSPYVQKYLGPVLAEDYNEAKILLTKLSQE